MELYDKIKETAAFIKSQINELPTVGIVLGSGLGIMADSIEMQKEIPYKDIPHFPVSTVMGHKGTLAFGKIKGKNAIMMKGRFHYYEGYDMETVTFPIRVMKELGVETLFISNAAGGMNKQFKVGDIMLIDDHINLFPDHPLRGPSDERLGIRFPDMSEPYSVDLLKTAQQAAIILELSYIMAYM
jgi:purine-nucleoside phosphorylase